MFLSTSLPGEAVGIVGNNGAGKSTLLKILSRITPPTHGHIDMLGTVGSLLEVGTGFHPELTGLENVYLNGAILGMSTREIKRRLEEILAFAEIDKFIDTPVKRYSSGMRVRLAFAVAAHLEPEILIVDEVLSVGDHAFQAKCLERMKSVAASEGRTVLYVSHQLATVEHLCPRALLIADGRLVFDGPTEETMAQYLRKFPRGEAADTPGVFDLASADRSNGAYEPLLQRLELRPGGGSPADNIRMGERLRIEISVAGLNDIIDPWVLVSIGSSKVPVLIRMNSLAVPLNSTQDRSDRELIVINIPALPLTPGDYRIEVQIKDRSKTVDFVGPAGEFRVNPADVFGGGYRFDSSSRVRRRLFRGPVGLGTSAGAGSMCRYSAICFNRGATPPTRSSVQRNACGLNSIQTDHFRTTSLPELEGGARRSVVPRRNHPISASE